MNFFESLVTAKADDIRLRSIPSKIIFSREQSNFFFFFLLLLEPSLDNDYQYLFYGTRVSYIHDIHQSNLLTRSNKPNQSKDLFLPIKIRTIIYKKIQFTKPWKEGGLKETAISLESVSIRDQNVSRRRDRSGKKGRDRHGIRAEYARNQGEHAAA